MGGNCCGSPRGFERVWVYKITGSEDQEFGDQASALAAQTQNHGKGRIQRVTRKVS
jgi:hypothetical protein